MTTETIGGLILRTNGEAEYIQIPRPRLAEFLHDFVGGWLEVVNLHNGCTMFLNEEGKLQGMSHNRKATVVMYYYARSIITDTHDHIVGPAIILGCPDDEGNEQGLSLKELGDFARVIEFGNHPSHPLSLKTAEELDHLVKTKTARWETDTQGIM